MNYQMFVLIWFILLADGSSLYGTPQSAIDRKVTITESDFTVLRIYDTDRGLPANGATSVIQDKKGYIWASTFNGLVRFDGNRVQTLNMNQVEGLGSNRFLTVKEGRSGKIYAGLEHGWLLIISENQNEVYRIDPEIYGTNISINAIYEDETETLWIGTESGILHFRNGEFEKVDSKIFDDFPVTMVQMIYPANGTIHILFTNALVTYEPETGEYQLLALYDSNTETLSFKGDFETTPDQKTGTFWQIHSVSDDEYLLIHDDGIFQLSDKGIQTVITGNELNCTLLYGMEISGDTHYIYGSNGVFSTENLFSNQPVFVHHNQLSVNYAITDHEGSLWLSTHAFGLIQMRETPVYQGQKFDPVSHVPVTAVLRGSDDALYVGTNCDALYVFEGEEFRRYSTEAGIRNLCIWSLLEQSDGTLWVGTWGDGVFYRSPGSEHFESFRPETMQDAEAILAMFEDSNGNIWFGSYYNGLFIYDGETVKNVLNRNGRLLSAVRKIFEDSNGQIYVASDRGIGILNDEFQIEKPEKFKLLKTLNFRTIVQDHQNRLWFGSYGGGIVIVDGEDSYVLTTENGLFDDTVSQLNFDDQGNLWLAGNLGVFTIENSEIETFLTGDKDRVRVARLGQYDGLHVFETTGGFSPSSYLSDSGELLIPSVRGLIKIDTPRYKVNRIVPKIYLEEVEVDGVIFRPDEIETLSHNDRRIYFQFSVLSYRNPANVEIEYKLEGFDDQWQFASESRSAVYTTLPQGRYNLKIRGSNNDGLWNEEGTEFEFTVTPPFWFTWWFFLGISLLFIWGVYAFYRYRVSRLERSKIELENEVEKRTLELKAANEELKQLVMEKNKMQRVLGHDLRNALSGIIGYLEMLKSEEDFDENKESSKIIDILLKSSRETLNLLENLLHFSGSTREAIQPVFKNTTIRQLVQEAIKIIEVQASQKEITVDLNCDRTISIEVDQQMMLSVLRNLISNSIKYSPRGGSVTVDVDETEMDLIISVTDRGVGMSADKIEVLFSDLAVNSQLGTMGEQGMGIGLQICKDFVSKHHGTIEIQSEPAKGSTFTVILPKEQGSR